MDCDDVILLVAEHRTPTAAERPALEAHLEGCVMCEEIYEESRARQRWIMQLPEAAFADGDLAVLPMVDPVVFVKGAVIARGGMATITRAHDRRLGRAVAVKEILEPNMRARFEREVRITARLQHPAIVAIYEAGTWPDGSAFYTMRLVPGMDLAEAIYRAKTLEARLALLPAVIATTEALAYAHAQRVVHRDLKPSNILVGEFGETVVIDWGLAKELDDTVADGDLTTVGSVIGTPGYMPPEQARGAPVDERADVYSLGAILYHLLGGSAPYYHDKATSDSILADSLVGPPQSLDELAPNAPPDLRAIVDRATARLPERRYPSAREMAEELRAFAAGKLLSREYTTRERIAHWIRRHRAISAATALAIPAVAIAVTVAVITMARSRDDERAGRLAAEDGRRTVDRQREAADHALEAFLEEQGRSALVAGDRARALPYLAAAYTRGRDGAALRYMLTAATRGAPTHAPADAKPLAPTAVCEPTRIRVVDASGAQVRELAVDGCKAVAATGDLVAAITGSQLRVWRDGVQLVSVAAPGSQGVAFDPSGRYAVAFGADVAILDTRSGRVVQLAHQPATAIRVQLDATGRRLAALRDDNTVTLWDLGTATKLVDARGPAFALSADGARLATGGADGAIAIWDSDSGRQLDAIANGALVVSLAWSADGATLLADGSRWDTRLEQRAPAAIAALGPWVLDGPVLRRRDGAQLLK